METVEKVLLIIGIAILILFHGAIKIAIMNNLNDIAVALKERNMRANDEKE